MQLESSVTLFDDNKVEDRFAELQITADGITSEVSKKVGNDEVISRINQSAEGVQIQANKVNIEGAAIFSSGRLSQSSLNNAYDANGSATGAVDNLKSDLSSASGTTVINGGHIATGSLSVGAVKTNSGTFDTENMPATARNDTYITDIGVDGIRVHDSHTSNNSVVINSNGMEVFKGGTADAYSVAKYSNIVRIGKPSGTSRIELDYHSMQLIDKEGGAYLHVSDLRNEQGITSVQDNFKGDGSTKMYDLSLVPIVSSLSVKVNGSTVTAYTITQGSSYITFTNAPANGATIVITYNTTDRGAKVFTFGTRSTGNVGAGSVSLGDLNVAAGNNSVAIGTNVDALGNYSHAEGISTTASGWADHAEGGGTTASGGYSHAEGYDTTASGYQSHAEGNQTTASGSEAHAEGNYTTASGSGSHAEGWESEASNSWAHAEGNGTKATGYASHAEGSHTTASDSDAHAEGSSTTASGAVSHAEGLSTTASGSYSHAEGMDTVASGMASHAGGDHTIARGEAQTVIGQYNVADTTSLFIIGKGPYESARANAFVVTKEGKVLVNGSTVHGSDRRLKEHISYIGDEAIEFIDGLKPAHYIKDEEKHVGFYAQDVEEIDKWDCMVGEMNGYKTLGYMELIAPLVAYVQKLEKRIEDLERSSK